MANRLAALILATMISFAAPSMAAEMMSVGGDNLITDSNATQSAPSPRDVLIAGFTINLTGRVEKDVDATGFTVNINAPIGSDLFASGFSIDVTQPIGEDVTAAGFNIHLGDQARIGGNARLTGGTVTIDAPISGSLAAAGANISLNNTIAGDALITMSKLNFGKDAKILGTLTYYATEPAVIPTTVISSDRVKYNKIEATEVSRVTTDITQDAARRFWPSFLGAITFTLLVIGFLVSTAAVLFAFAPRKMDDWASDSIAAPVKSITLGVLGLSASIGLVPVSAMTLIGIPLVPIAILVSIAIWIIGYIVGTYALAIRITGAFRAVPSSMGGRLLLLALAIIAATLLNFIPVIGWLINLALVFLGLGALVLNCAKAIAHQEVHVPTVATPEPANQTAAMTKRGSRARS